MDKIISPIDKKILEAELSGDKFLRTTNKGDNRIYVINHFNAPQVMREIGRVREQTFRDAGGGTGHEVDIDEFDTAQVPYQQLIVWSPEDKEIIGGYRFIKCGDVKRNSDGSFPLATAGLFHFSEKFISDYLPYTIELGRSFVQTRYQPSAENRKGLFTLDNLWDGLGAIVVDSPEIKYLFGKVTMYLDFNAEARDMILHFMNKYFPDPERLVYPHHPLSLKTDVSEFDTMLNGLPYKEGHAILGQKVRALNENIPPLINSYMNLSATMKTFGTSLNDHFGEVEETGILVTIPDIYPSKKERHLVSYRKGV